MKRFAALLFIGLLLGVMPAVCWVESIEFPWNTFPRHLWERELVWMKNIGVRHVTLPAPKDPAEVVDLLRLVRSLQIEANLEGPVPAALLPYTRAHGGPLMEALPSPAARLSALQPNALIESRKLLATGTAFLIWTDVEDTLGATGYHPGAVNFQGDEKVATIPIRRNAQLLHFWADVFGKMSPLKGATAVPPEINIEQFVSPEGVSAIMVSNSSAKEYKGGIRVLYPPAKKTLSIPAITVPAHNSLWLPVNIPIGGSAICRSCSAFAATDHLVYSTAELTSMEYENGILAMEFSAPAPAEVILQLSRQPSGPYVASGKPTEFEWDQHTQRVKLEVPAGKGAGERVRVGLAIEPPDATAFFESARVLIIGEKNSLTAQFSSEEISKRARLVTPASFRVTSHVKSPLEIVYDILVPAECVHGDHADLAIEADGVQLSHSRPQLLRAASLRFADAVSVRLSPTSTLAMLPAAIPVVGRSGREIAVSIRNNAPEIRNFDLRLTAPGLEFSPASIQVSVGASTVREVKFRMFPTEVSSGTYEGAAVLSGAAYWKEPIRLIILPTTSTVAWQSGKFSFVESAKIRATFLAGDAVEQWIEFLDKDKSENRLQSPTTLPSPHPGLDQLEKQLPKAAK